MLSFEQWAARLTRYLAELERVFSPDLFIIGGGVSKHAARFLHLIDITTPLRPATLSIAPASWEPRSWREAPGPQAVPPR